MTLVLALAGGVAMSLCVETVGRHLTVNIQTLLEEVPKRIRISRTGESTGHTDDGNLVILSTTTAVMFGGYPGGVVASSDG